MSLVTAAELRQAGIPQLSGNADDTYLGVLIGRAEAALARALRFPPASTGGTPSMASTAYTLDHDGPGGVDLALRVWPATTITSVYDDPTRLFTSSSYLVSSADYGIQGQGQILRLKDGSTWGSWGRGSGRIRVAFTAGYSTAPEELKQAIIEACQELLRRRSGTARATQTTPPNGTAIAMPVTDRWLPAHVLEGVAHLTCGDVL